MNFMVTCAMFGNWSTFVITKSYCSNVNDTTHETQVEVEHCEPMIIA